MIVDWKDIAAKNNLTFKEFTLEIMQAAAVIAVENIDSNTVGDLDTFKFTTKDDIGKIEIYIRRIK